MGKAPSPLMWTASLTTELSSSVVASSGYLSTVMRRCYLVTITVANSVAVPWIPDVPSAAEPGKEIMPVTQAATQDDDNANGISPAAAIRLPVDAHGVSLGTLSTVAVVFAIRG